MERLRKLVGPFILRRLKRDVAQDLPDKNESVVLSQMQGEQDKLYRASASRLALMLADQTPAEFAGQRIKVLAELTKLRQICCDPHLLYENYKGNSAKLETCMELVHQAVDGGHAVLLFSQFTSMLQIIGEKLDAEKVRWFKLTGATSTEARARLVERFQAGEVPVFLISLKAGGTGLNLTAADIVIHYDPWWNLAAQNQATDRTHRIGQDKEVSVFKLIAKDTVEEKIVALQEAKQDLADSVLSGEAAGSASITRDDLLALLDQD
jgi:SNF2 family DNA or RNA helicase